MKFNKATITKDTPPTEECICTHPTHLGEDDDGEWLAAIVDNHPEKVQEILNNATPEQKERLLNHHFWYKDGHVSRHLQGRCFRLRLPLTLAMAVGSYKIVEILLREGTDPGQQDCHGNNVIHSMVMYTFYNPQLEESILEIFNHLVKLIPEDQMRSILQTENDFGLRPLEFAAQHGCCFLVTAILDIPGTYLAKEERHGLTTYQWYDVTDYEATGERFEKSPQLFVTFLDESIVSSPSFCAFAKHTVMDQWLDARFSANMPFILMLLLFRCMFITAYFILDMDTGFYGDDFVPGNSTDRCRPDFALAMPFMTRMLVRGFLLFCALCVLTVDLLELVTTFTRKYWAMRYTVEGRKNWQVQVTFYRLSNLIFCMFIVIYTIIGFISCNCFTIFYDITRVTCPVLAVWNILYFIQLLPSIGCFVITIQAILQDLLNFIIIYIIFMIPFMHSFQTVINTNTNVGCVESFDSMFRIVYSLFITMLNMIDYTAYDIRNQEVLLVAHVTYTFVVSIMMINFFIALLSGSVSRISSCTGIVLRFQRSSVALLMERRCQWIFPSLYTWLKKRYFQYEDGRFYVVRIKPSQGFSAKASVEPLKLNRVAVNVDF